MSKKKLRLLTTVITVIAIVLCIIVFVFPHQSVSSGDKNPPPQENPDVNPPKGPLLTVPESPFGALGLLSAIALALFASYALSKNQFPKRS